MIVGKGVDFMMQQYNNKSFLWLPVEQKLTIVVDIICSERLIMATPKRLDLDARAKTMKGRIEKCWSQDINWSLYPLRFRKVR